MPPRNKFLLVGPDKGRLRTLLEDVGKGAGLPLAGIRNEPFSDPDTPTGPHVGYRMRDIATGENAVVAHMSWGGPPRVDKYGVDTSAIDRILGITHAQPLEARLVLIDEIGPIELSSDQFNAWVADVLSGPGPVVAIIDYPLLEGFRQLATVHELKTDADFQPILDSVLIGVQP